MILELTILSAAAVCGGHGGALWQMWRRRGTVAYAATPAWHRSALLRLGDPLVHAIVRALQRRAVGRRWLLAAAQRIRWPYGVQASSAGVILQSLLWGLLFGVVAYGLSAGRGVTALLLLGGAALPWLAWRAVWRQWNDHIRRDLPMVLELLALTVDAGLELSIAAQRVLAVLPPGPLRTLLQRRDDDLALGVTQEQAWRDWAARAGHPLLQQLVAVLLQSQRLGAPVSQVLLDHLEQYHAARLADAEQAGMVAGQKLLLPIMCCTVPAYFLLTFGGLAITLLLHGSEGIFRIFL